MVPPKFTVYEKCGIDLQKIGFTLWIYAAVQFVLGNFFSLPQLIFGLDMTWLTLFLATIVSGLVALLAGLDSTRTRIHGLKAVPCKGFSTYLQALCVTYFCSMVFGLLFTVFGVDNDVLPQTYGIGEMLLSFITVGILGPIIEELFFRGFVFGCLRKYGSVFAAIMSSLAFSMLHLNFVQGLPVFFFGLVFCWAYRRTDSLWIPIALHITNNMVALIAGYAWWLGFVILAVALAGFIILLVRLPRIAAYVQEISLDKPFFQTVESAPAFWGFGIFFILFSVVQVFL